MQHYHVSSKNHLIINSEPIQVNSKKIYEFKIEVSCIKGASRCCYITIIFLNERREEIQRRQRFVGNFSSVKKEYSIVSAVPNEAKYAVLGFRANCEGTQSTDIIIKLPSVNTWTLNIVNPDSMDSHDDFYDYKEHYKQYDLESDHWTIVGGGTGAEDFRLNGKKKVQKLIDCGLDSNSTLLDVGCGTSILLESLSSYLSSPRNYVGVDISSDAIDFCKRHYPKFEFHLCEATRMPKINRKFDMICMYSVLTHMYPSDSVELLSHLKQFLNEGGCIVASVILNSNVSSCTGTRNRMEFNEKYFFELVKSAGFSKVERMDPPLSGNFQDFLTISDLGSYMPFNLSRIKYNAYQNSSCNKRYCRSNYK